MTSNSSILLAPSPPPITRTKHKVELGTLTDCQFNPSVPSQPSTINSTHSSKRKRDSEIVKPVDDSFPVIYSTQNSKQLKRMADNSRVSFPLSENENELIELGDTLDEPDENICKAAIEDIERDELESDEAEDEDEEDEAKFPLHIEVRLRSNSTILYDTVRRAIGQHITDNFTSLETHASVPGWQEIKFLADEVDSVYCAESAHPCALVLLSMVYLHIHVYELPVNGHDRVLALCVNAQDSNNLDHQSEMDDGLVESQEGDVAASRLELPANRLEGIWESLIYEEGLKTRLLNYIYSSIVFAEQNVNQALISWHRLVLLHGPPGTGKTSLCRALSQKVSIRLSGIYQKTELVEINSHSLFSKWFSESGKLVDSLFTKIEQMAEETDVFVMVLIDEVESLAGSRSSGAAGSEPSDALRAVNALLTALDRLRTRRNVLVLTTSNLTGSIDHAFLDRADIKQYIGLPTPEATYWILRTCLVELVKVGIIRARDLIDYKEAVMIREALDDRVRVRIGSNNLSGVVKVAKISALQKSRNCSSKLLEIAERATGMSGRALRRLPLLAHARTTITRSASKKLSMESYLEAMLKVVQEDGDSAVKPIQLYP